MKQSDWYERQPEKLHALSGCCGKQEPKYAATAPFGAVTRSDAKRRISASPSN